MTITEMATAEVRQHNVAHSAFKWIPLRQDGRDVRVSLREAIAHADRFQDFASTLIPAERDALLRFLTAMTAAAGANMNEDELWDFGQSGLLPASRVDNFIATHDDLFWLLDPIGNRPWMQQWGLRVGCNETAFRDLRQFAPMRPGESAHQWNLRRETVAPLTPEETAFLTTVAWFAWSRHSNSASLGKGRPAASFSVDGKTGSTAPLTMLGNLTFQNGQLDQTYCWIGPNLALTIGANLPATWLEDDQTLPAWMDQSLTPKPAHLEKDDSLWRSTFAANRIVLRWNEDGSVSAAPTGTPTPIPSTRGHLKARKEQVTKAHEFDYLRAWRSVQNKKGETTLKAIRTKSGGLSSLTDLRTWFANDLCKEVRQTLALRAVSEFDPSGWRIASHAYVAKMGTGAESRWVEAELDVLFPRADTNIRQFDDDMTEWAGAVVSTVIAIASFVEYRVRDAFVLRVGNGDDKSRAEAASARAGTQFRHEVIGVVSEYLTGAIELDKAHVLIAETALRAFDGATSGFTRTNRAVIVANARARLVGAVRKELSEIAPPPSTTGHRG